MRELKLGILAGIAALAGLAHAAAPAKSDAELIASAQSAAPSSISADATVVTMDAAGNMRTVKQGSNGWTCMPGKTPMCADPNGWEWNLAYMAHKPPPDKVGFMYMLKGGDDASNTDPYAKAPAPGAHSIITGPHIMVLGPAVKLMPGYLKGADPDTSKPYVMWGGTPYEHLMIPAK